MNLLFLMLNIIAFTVWICNIIRDTSNIICYPLALIAMIGMFYYALEFDKDLTNNH